MEAGARVEDLNAILFESKTRERMAIEKVALDNLEYHFDGRCALMYMTQEEIAASGVNMSDLEDLTGLPRKIEGCRWA